MSALTLLRISRPRFWFYLAGPYLLGFLFGGGDFFNPSLLAVSCFFFFLTIANFYLYGINDLFDRETDALNPKKQNKEHLLQTKEIAVLKFLLFFSLLITAGLVFFQPNTISKVLLIIYTILATFYSAPPFRFKSKPIIDSASNILYAFPGFIAYSALTGEMVSFSVLLLTLCWTAAMHLYSAIPDIKADKEAGLYTSAILLGQKVSLLACFVLWSVFSFLVISSSWQFPFVFVALIYPALPLFIFFSKKDIERIYWYFPYLNSLIGFLAFFSFFFK
jgi:4-hydroxybenzoate polyprenyltransferase